MVVSGREILVDTLVVEVVELVVVEGIMLELVMVEDKIIEELVELAVVKLTGLVDKLIGELDMLDKMLTKLLGLVEVE